MRFRAILAAPALILLVLAIGTLAQAIPRSRVVKGLPEDQSISGKIANVGDAQFTVAVSRDKDQQGPQSVEFFVDDKTRVEGKLAVGAQALVEYRSDAGRNIAVHVVITAAAGAAVVAGAVVQVPRAK